MFYRVQIKSRQPAVTSVVAEVESQLQGCGLDQEQTGEVCLILAEALNNVVEHAYRYSGDGDIFVEVRLQGEKLKIVINDFGPKFSPPKPMEPRKPDLEDLEDLPEGGFGWNLIRSLTDSISLSRVHDRNHLEMTKYLEQSKPVQAY